MLPGVAPEGLQWQFRRLNYRQDRTCHLGALGKSLRALRPQQRFDDLGQRGERHAECQSAFYRIWRQGESDVDGFSILAYARPADDHRASAAEPVPKADRIIERCFTLTKLCVASGIGDPR